MYSCDLFKDVSGEMPARNIYFIRATDIVGGGRQTRFLAHKPYFQHVFVLSFRSAVQRLQNMPYIFAEVFIVYVF